MPLSHIEKDPAKARAGRIGMASRWGNPANRRTVRIADLSPEARALVLALVAAAKSASSEEAAA